MTGRNTMRLNESNKDMKTFRGEQSQEAIELGSKGVAVRQRQQTFANNEIFSTPSYNSSA